MSLEDSHVQRGGGKEKRGREGGRGKEENRRGLRLKIRGIGDYGQNRYPSSRTNVILSILSLVLKACFF
jgi:hypothetical protein